MKLKICKNCNNEYPKTEVFFRRNGKSWRSKCKNCLNKNLPKKTEQEKKEQKAKSHKIWAKKNREKRNKYQRELRQLNPEKSRELNRKISSKKREELSDEYLIRLICRRTGFDKKAITKEAIETKRLIIKLKREINYGQSKKLKF